MAATMRKRITHSQLSERNKTTKNAGIKKIDNK
jgi:hypothetical protein